MRRPNRSRLRRRYPFRSKRHAAVALLAMFLGSRATVAKAETVAEASGPKPATLIGAPNVAGYMQVDYVLSAESRDQLNDANQLTAGATLNSQGQLSGSTGQSSDANSLLLNQNRFLLRRARVQLFDELRAGPVAVDYALQVDANSIAGLALGLRDAEVGVSWSVAGTSETSDARRARWPINGQALANGFRLRLGAGVFRSPFGHDTSELSHADRLFSEPTLLANAFFPGDYDLGVRLRVDYNRVFAVAAIMNGEPVGGRAFPSRDPNAAKDLFFRVGGRTELSSWLVVEGGVSLVEGTGFHPGTPPTKDSLVWRDFNEDGIAQPFEIQVIRGASATESENFNRWAVGADLRADIALPIGRLHLFGEGATAVNMDRGIDPADPVLTGAPQRGITIHGGFVQEVGRYVLVGARADQYTSRIDATDTQGGQLVRANRPYSYLSFAAAIRLFESEKRRGRARLMIEYGLRRDQLSRDVSGRPTDLDDDRLTARLQVEY